ncbi:MAG: type III pantothenate kinase [Pseudomonadota bacterium]
MLLAIDSGNTNTVFSCVDPSGQAAHVWRISTKSARTADEYMVWISQLLDLAKINASDIDAAIIATVVPPTLFQLRTLCRSYFKVDPLVVGDTDVDLGIGIKVPNPQEVGADRLVNAVAAFDQFGGPAIIIDFGTATTFDVIDEYGDYCGGVIAPGINLSLEALYQGAAKLPRIAIERPKTMKVIGTSTISAMQSGVMWGYVGLIEGLVDRITAEWGKPMKVIATGGLASIFDDQSHIIDEVDKGLTLRGLWLISCRQKECAVDVSKSS